MPPIDLRNHFDGIRISKRVAMGKALAYFTKCLRCEREYRLNESISVYISQIICKFNRCRHAKRRRSISSSFESELEDSRCSQDPKTTYDWPTSKASSAWGNFCIRAASCFLPKAMLNLTSIQGFTFSLCWPNIFRFVSHFLIFHSESHFSHARRYLINSRVYRWWSGNWSESTLELTVYTK